MATLNHTTLPNDRLHQFHRILIYHPRDGVYLGEIFGLGFWSTTDNLSLPGAITFSTPQAAKEYLNRCWNEEPESFKQQIEIRPVQTANDGHATITEIEAVGLPGWPTLTLSPALPQSLKE